MKDSEKADRNVDAKSIVISVMDALGVNAPAFAEAIGINYQRVYDLMRGRTKKFNPGVVNLICSAYPQVNEAYLYTGKGEVLKEIKPAEDSAADIKQEGATDIDTLLHRVVANLDNASSRADRLLEWERKLLDWERQLNLRELEITRKEKELGMK